MKQSTPQQGRSSNDALRPVGAGALAPLLAALRPSAFEQVLVKAAFTGPVALRSLQSRGIIEEVPGQKPIR